MKAGAMLLIAAMLIAPAAAILSAKTVTAQVPTFMVKPEKSKADVSIVVTITVTNPSGAESIENIRILPSLVITNPGDLENLAPVVVLPKDEVIRTGDDNVVVIPAGTVVKLSGDVRIPAGENVQIPKGGYVARDNYHEPGGSYELQLEENLLATITNEDINVGTGAKGTMDNLSLTLTDENVSTTEDLEVIIDNATVELVEDTWAIRTPVENVYLVVSDTVVEIDNLVVSASVGAGNIFKNENIRSATVDETVDIDPAPTDNVGRIFIATHDTDGTPYDVSEDENIVIVAGTNINLLPGTRLVTDTVRIKLQENQEVIRAERENVVADIVVENAPLGWMQHEGTIGGEEYVEWVAIGPAGGENALLAGESENFPFALSIPNQAGTYHFDAYLDGSYVDDAFTIEVDNQAPTITVEVSPDWVKDNVAVTITITANEEVSIDDVFVCENNGENVAVSLTTDDNKTFTGTYTTGDNDQRDGYATIYVVGAKDEVGNRADVTEDDLLFIDRRPPVVPNLDDFTGLLPPKINDLRIDNRNDFEDITASFEAADDNLVWIPSVEISAIRDGLRVEFFVDGVSKGFAEVGPLGSMSPFDLLDLADGRREIGVRLTDRAGNVGEENLENVIIDVTKPSVNIQVTTVGGETVADGGFAPENKVVITVTISDTTLGIENLDLEILGDNLARDFIENENFDRGYVVIFELDNGDPISNIDNIVLPKVYPVIENVENVRPNVFLSYTFENETVELPELPAGRGFLVTAYAGDSMNYAYGKGPHRAMDNHLFYIDIRPPEPPTLTYQYPATTLIEPEKTTTATWYMAGTTEPGATIIIYITRYNPDGTLKAARAQLTTVSADPTTGDWEYTIDIKGYQGEIVFIETSAKDQAGNEGDRSLYGYFMYDKSPPTVTLDIEEMTTGEEIVVITGSVTPDPWESPADITISVTPVGAGYSYDPATGNFQISVPLREGKNLVGVTATDPLGNSSSDSATVIRTVTPWATYAIIVVILALILAAIAIFRRT